MRTTLSCRRLTRGRTPARWRSDPHGTVAMFTQRLRLRPRSLLHRTPPRAIRSSPIREGREMVLVAGGGVVLAVTSGLFWFCLPRGGETHRFVDTELEPYVAVAF